jgi:hypothetical protein
MRGTGAGGLRQIFGGGNRRPKIPGPTLGQRLRRLAFWSAPAARPRSKGGRPKKTVAPKAPQEQAVAAGPAAPADVASEPREKTSWLRDSALVERIRYSNIAEAVRARNSAKRVRANITSRRSVAKQPPKLKKRR